MTKLTLPKPMQADPGALLQSLTLFADELDRRLAFGTGTFTFTGIANAATAQISHGLGFMPVAVLVTPGVLSGVNLNPACGATTLGAETFLATAHTVDAQTPGGGSTVTFYWLAIR